MSKALEIIEKSLNQTFDSGLVIEVLNTDLTKKSLTILVNRTDEWCDAGSGMSALDTINAILSQTVKQEPNAIGFKSTGFRLEKKEDGSVELIKNMLFKPQFIQTNVNMG